MQKPKNIIRKLLPATIAGGLFTCTTMAQSIPGLPEPGFVMYGSVTNTSGNAPLSGLGVVWRVAGPTGAATNAATFGLCARPNFHGHSYICDVTVKGSIDAATGFIVDLGVLDKILTDEVRSRFDHRNINLDVPEFGDGGLIPTGENLARFIFERVGAALPQGVEIDCVTIAEDQTLSASWRDE